MEEKKPEKFSREWFKEQGRIGGKKRYEGMTEKQISEHMKKVRKGKKIKK